MIRNQAYQSGAMTSNARDKRFTWRAVRFRPIATVCDILPRPGSHAGSEDFLEDLYRLLHDPRTIAAIPGVSIAVLRRGRIAWVHARGTRGPHDRREVDGDTVFEAGSLTKPLISFIALQLAQEGRLNLHAPLGTITPGRVEGDERASRITGAHVLAHTSGLPNIASEATPLKTYFEPGSRFNYGSSAFSWLQRAMEASADASLEELAQDRVFSVFGMTKSSLLWQERFERNHAQGHDMEGRPLDKRRPAAAGASWSLQTTATDYARFLEAVLAGVGLSAAMRARWFDPVVQARDGVDDVLNQDAAPTEGVAWGLGWGLEPSNGCFFHWGNVPGFRAFVIASGRTGDGIVWFANSARGLDLARHVLPSTAPGHHPSLDWLHVGRLFDD